ncbi:hypothetical protein EHS25_010076 [Saitozyma podzolica]|uniref:Sphingolipid homeostasis protein orm1 n=1 Tax=Saitozyma podzolica TaxID=1890683 RepID=A0A427YIK2_9TREE|nr:hypothetical protein EHS25_010076 [Saitozyma podzolica]
MSPPPAVTLTTPPSPARASSILRAVAPSTGPDAPPVAAGKAVIKGRARSSSLVTVTEVGGDELETVVDRLGVGTNENADWVNAPGAWLIHPVLILLCKLLVDAIPGMTQDVGWTVINLGYMAVSFLMFHHVTGVPFESHLTTGGAYDDLTLWEQIDGGAQYTPARKWLTSVPIGLFLISTHYTKYDPVLFTLNFAALVFVLFPKLPILHRLRITVLPEWLHPDPAATPLASRPPSPRGLSEAAKVARANGKVVELRED